MTEDEMRKVEEHIDRILADPLGITVPPSGGVVQVCINGARLYINAGISKEHAMRFLRKQADERTVAEIEKNWETLVSEAVSEAKRLRDAAAEEN